MKRLIVLSALCGLFLVSCTKKDETTITDSTAGSTNVTPAPTTAPPPPPPTTDTSAINTAPSMAPVDTAKKY